MNKVSVFFLSSIIASFFFFPAVSGAQSADTSNDLSIPGQIGDIQEQISSTVEPAIPSPGQQVTITLEAYGTDLNRAKISWNHNGRIELSGEAEKKFVFTASSIGTTDNITATVTPFNGPDVVKTFTISPAEIDLLWEANTYTPPFYKGKALFTPQADVNFVAIPNMISNGSRVSGDKVVYKWLIDYSVQGDKSGYGRNTFSYSGPIILSPHIFEVDGYDSANPDVTAVMKTTLNASDPIVNIYEDHPLYGVLFNKALVAPLLMTDTEKKINAYPYYFSTTNKNAGVTYEWNLNDSILQVPPTQNTMSFRKTSADTGTADIRVRVDSTTKLLQEAFGFSSLYFDSNNSIFLK